jgi:hypothetical protein
MISWTAVSAVARRRALSTGRLEKFRKHELRKILLAHPGDCLGADRVADRGFVTRRSPRLLDVLLVIADTHRER